jgi:polyisoprenoid-binding protein YceI
MAPDTTRPDGDTRVKDRAAYPPPGTWTFDKAHTTIGFVARHMLAKVRGRFTQFEGTVVVAERPEGSSVEVRIEAASLTTDTQMRDDHLRSDDFLEVETYPQLTFMSKELRPTDESTFDLVGDLTIKDVTREVVLAAEFGGFGPTADGSGTVAFFSASTEIDREAWDMTWNVAVETGGWLVGRRVQIEIEAELNLQE